MSSLTPLLPLPAAPQFRVSSRAAIVSSLLGTGAPNPLGTDDFSSWAELTAGNERPPEILRFS